LLAISNHYESHIYLVKQRGAKAEPFFYETEVGKNEVLVKSAHCGIATGDIQLINNDWGDTKFPMVPGHEIIGIIEKTDSKIIGLKNGTVSE
jgi:D-arabinose 1-dehydrogenase-like Zn-dependent alcohol dehydrogenase